MGLPASVDRVAGIIREKGLEIVQDTGALLAAINEVIGKNAKIVADYKSGKQAAAGALIGQVMKLVKGADATVVRQLILKQLDAG